MSERTRTEDVPQLAFLSSITILSNIHTHAYYHHLSILPIHSHTFPYIPIPVPIQPEQPARNQLDQGPPGIQTILFYSILFNPIQSALPLRKHPHPRLTTSLRHIATNLGPSHLLYAMHRTASSPPVIQTLSASPSSRVCPRFFPVTLLFSHPPPNMVTPPVNPVLPF